MSENHTKPHGEVQAIVNDLKADTYLARCFECNGFFKLCSTVSQAEQALKDHLSRAHKLAALFIVDDHPVPLFVRVPSN